MKELVKLGKIVRPHGVRGEVKIMSDFDDTMLSSKLNNVFIDDNSIKVKNVKFMNNCIVLKLEGIDSMNDAESFRGKEVFISHDDLNELSEDEYYVEDLIGCNVVFENGKEVGKLSDVNNYGATDILVIKDGTEEIMCPLVEGLLIDVDFDMNKIIINKEKFLEVTVYAD